MRQFGLDRSLWDQYLIFSAICCTASSASPSTNARRCGHRDERLPNSIALTLSALIVAYAFGVTAGAFLACQRGTGSRASHSDRAGGARGAGILVGMVLLAVFSFHPDGSLGRRQQAPGSSTAARRGASPRSISSPISPCRP